MEVSELIEKTAISGADNTVQALALAQQSGMINSSDDLKTFLRASFETMIEEFVVEYNNLKPTN
jgi:hypothetical protein